MPVCALVTPPRRQLPYTANRYRVVHSQPLPRRTQPPTQPIAYMCTDAPDPCPDSPLTDTDTPYSTTHCRIWLCGVVHCRPRSCTAVRPSEPGVRRRRYGTEMLRTAAAAASTYASTCAMMQSCCLTSGCSLCCRLGRAWSLPLMLPIMLPPLLPLLLPLLLRVRSPSGCSFCCDGRGVLTVDRPPPPMPPHASWGHEVAVPVSAFVNDGHVTTHHHLRQ